MTLKHTLETPEVLQKMSVMGRFLPILLQQTPQLVLAYTVSALGVALSLTLPWPMKFLIDDVLTGANQTSWLQGLELNQQVVVLASVMAVLAALTAVVLGYDKIFHARVRERFGFALRAALIQSIYRMSRGARNDERSGELTMRLVSDANQVSRLFCKTAPTALKHVAVALGAIAMTFMVSTTIGFAAIGTAVLFATIVVLYGPSLARTARAKRVLEGNVSALTQETVNGIEHVQAMGLELQTRERYLAEAAAALEAGVTEAHAAVRLERSSQIVAGFSLAIVAGIGGGFVVSGELSLGSLTVCLAYLAQLMKPIEKINEIASAVSSGFVRAERLEQVFVATPAISVNSHAVKTIESVDDISFHNVSYTYPGFQRPIIDKFNFSFKKGQCTAIVGPSGSGKSTLLRLLLRLQTPNEGELRASGIAYADIEPLALQSQFAVVLQPAHLFAGTFREVLTELNPNVGDQRVRQVLFDVRLLDVIGALPFGLDSPLDEAGDRISSGQRARLLLARALLGDRPVLVLDEPFANIDQTSKKIILSRLAHIKQGRILIVVTHEQELLQLADHVIDIAAFSNAISSHTGTGSNHV